MIRVGHPSTWFTPAGSATKASGDANQGDMTFGEETHPLVPGSASQEDETLGSRAVSKWEQMSNAI
jgi:hypothetical protein